MPESRMEASPLSGLMDGSSSLSWSLVCLSSPRPVGVMSLARGTNSPSTPPPGKNSLLEPSPQLLMKNSPSSTIKSRINTILIDLSYHDTVISDKPAAYTLWEDVHKAHTCTQGRIFKIF